MKISALIASFLLATIKSVVKTANDLENWKKLLLNSTHHVWDFDCHKNTNQVQALELFQFSAHSIRFNCCRARNKTSFYEEFDL